MANVRFVLVRQHLVRAIAIAALCACTLAGIALRARASVSATTVELKAEVKSSLHWGYAGTEGPEFWGTLASEYAQCSTGTQQSPIDLKPAQAIDANLEEPMFNYRAVPLDIANTGHTVRVSYAPGSTLTLDGQTYDLRQFHFHDPSEHTVDGEPYPMEVHLVHQSASTGDLVVVGIFLDLGKANPTLQLVWDAMPPDMETAIAAEGMTLNAADLLPANTQDFYRYSGSLTTPPCSESVTWIVMKETAPVSLQQVEQFAAAVGNNARPIQTSDRRILSN